MKRVRQDVWVTDDGAKWLNREEALARERTLRVDAMLQEKTYRDMTHDSVVEILLELLAEGKLILPPPAAKQGRLL